MDVIKRDGTLTKYDVQKIENAIQKAIIQSEANIHADMIAAYVDSKIKSLNKCTMSVQEIHYFVEDALMDFDHDTARAYVEYRKQRDLVRESSSVLMTNVKGLIEQTNDEILNENANKDAKIIPTQRDLLAGIISKHCALNQILPRDVANAHTDGDIHYHDLDYSPFFQSFNCMLVDVNNMLTHGFKMGNARIETPKSIETATAVTAQIIAQVASHIYGGNTINRIDEILAPYVTMTYEKELKKLKDIREATKQELLKTVFSHEVQKMLATDELLEELAKTYTEKHVYDAFQALEYEINSLFCANGQTPFTTLGFGLGTSWESRMIQKAILKVRLEGLGKEKHTAIFPKLVFGIKKGVNFGLSDPNYDIKQLALECSAKRMYPDILNYDKTVEVTGSFKFPMGCRSFLDQWFDENGNEVHEGRNNLGVVSLNLPRIGIEAKQNKEKFFEILNDRLEICHKALKTRIQRLENVKASVAPILYCEGAMGVRLKPEDNVSELFKNGRASISLGYIGLHEVANSMFGLKEHTFDSKEKQEFIISVIKELKNKVNQWRQESGYGYSLYSTPSESLCNRFCSLDVKKFGTIEGVNDKGYYTNSFHLDVEKSVNPYEKILFEKEFVPFASGGFINYGEYPNMQKNIEALEQVWDFSYDHVPYYGTNTPVDKCFVCNYSGEFTATSEGYECPKCHNKDGKKMNVIRRVCGYLGEPDARPFIYGKQQEVMRRVKHL